MIIVCEQLIIHNLAHTDRALLAVRKDGRLSHGKLALREHIFVLRFLIHFFYTFFIEYIFCVFFFFSSFTQFSLICSLLLMLFTFCSLHFFLLTKLRCAQAKCKHSSTQQCLGAMISGVGRDLSKYTRTKQQCLFGRRVLKKKNVLAQPNIRTHIAHTHQTTT